jgi:tRNA dimethylallyltransferase
MWYPQEAHWLLEQGLQPNERCAARAIGYRQAMEFLHKCKADHKHITASNLVICPPMFSIFNLICQQR